MPLRPRQPRAFVQRALIDLRQVKLALQGAQEDFGGHKDSAIAACDKALEELNAVMKAMPAPAPPQRFSQPGSQFQNNLTPLPSGGPSPKPAPPVAPPAAAPQP
jgi:hypothetical protein